MQVKLSQLPSIEFEKRSKLPKDKRGIYFVTEKDKVIYVGRTNSNFYERWANHHQSCYLKKKGDIKIKWYSLDVSEEKLRELELKCIDLYKPELNSQYKEYDSDTAQENYDFGRGPIPDQDQLFPEEIEQQLLTPQRFLQLFPYRNRDYLALVTDSSRDLVAHWFSKGKSARKPHPGVCRLLYLIHATERAIADQKEPLKTERSNKNFSKVKTDKKVAEMVRFSVKLPDWYHRKLKLWAALKGTNRATLAANIVQARIEANWEEVSRELDAIAAHEGISREELEDRWLKTKDDD